MRLTDCQLGDAYQDDVRHEVIEKLKDSDEFWERQVASSLVSSLDKVLTKFKRSCRRQISGTRQESHPNVATT